MHVLQTILQKVYSQKKYGKSLIKHLNEIGLTANNVTYGHAVWLTEEDIEIMAATGTSVTHHASCNLNMRNGISPVIPLINAGVLVAIGLDDKGINDDEDLIQEMRLIHKPHRLSGFHFTSASLNAVHILKMATVNAAHVIGFSNIGKLKEVNKADVILVNLDNVLEPWISPDV
ncbi:MAG: amidohydrolase family protein, partial [Clostridiales bacterium]|nr:amidohydrolase family protein [Clostridiales bacterium]